MPAATPSPQTTLVVLLGASEWPYSPDFPKSKAFTNAARRLKEYFLHPQTFGLPAENLLDLFDSDQSADDLDREIEQFLDQRISRMKEVGLAARDLVVYFVGHGGFAGGDAEYYLAVRRTRAANPTASSIQIVSLAHTLKEKARYLRRIVILDCCFAASAFSAFQATPAQAAITQTLDAFKVSGKGEDIPGRGTSLLCSSRHNRPSLLLPDGSSTMFSKALLEALATGNPHRKGLLSLQDVASLAEDFLRAMATEDAPRPEVHSPDQSEGDIAQLPFFPNPVARATGASANAETSSVAEKPPQPIIHGQPSQARPDPLSTQTQQQPHPGNAGPGSAPANAASAPISRPSPPLVRPSQVLQSAPATNQSPTTAFSSAPPLSRPVTAHQPQGLSKTKTIVLIGLVCVLVLGSLSLFFSPLARWIITQGKGGGSPTVIPSVPTTGTPIYPPAVTNFTMFGFDPLHTHFNPAEKTLNPGNVSRLKTGWINKTGGGIDGSPIIANGIAYVGSDKMYAFDARTGKTVWTASLDSDDRIEGSPTFADGMVYVGGNKLYAFNAQTGRRVWTARVGTQKWGGNPGPFITYGAPTIVNGVVYIGSTDTFIKMYAFDAKSGKQLWAVGTNGIIVSSPAVVDNIVYIGTYNGIFYALDAKTGAKIWTVSIADSIYSSPTVVNNTVYVGNYGGKIYAFDAKTGRTPWSTDLGGSISSPAFAEGELYVSSDEKGLFKLNASTGQILWNAKTVGGRMSASPTIANGVVYIGSSEDHKMYAFDAKTGTRLWSAPWTDGTGQDNISFNCTSIVANGVVYVGSGDGKLYTYYLPT